MRSTVNKFLPGNFARILVLITSLAVLNCSGKSFEVLFGEYVASETSSGGSSSGSSSGGLFTDTLELVSATAVNNTTVVITFDEDVEAADAVADISNWVISPGLMVTSAVLDLDKGSVTLVTQPMTSGTQYTITVNSAIKAEDGSALDSDNTITFTGSAAADAIGPVVQSITSTSSTKIALVFNEELDETSAQDVSGTNYDVFTQLNCQGPSSPNVSAAVRNSGNWSRVELTTATQANTLYYVRIQGVKDKWGNTMNSTCLQMQGTGSDTTSPTVTGITQTSPTSLQVTFSECMNQNAALTATNNYTIDCTPDPDPAVSSVTSSSCDQVTVNFAAGASQGASCQVNILQTTANIEDTSGNDLGSSPFNTGTFSNDTGDSVAPQITNVNANKNTEMTVTFSEPMGNESALESDPASYFSIAGLTVTGAVCTPNGAPITCVLTTSEQGNQNYTLTTTGLQDANGNDLTPTSFGPVAGDSKPAIDDIQVKDQNTVWVVFDEPVNNYTTTGDYTFDNGLTVNTVTCHPQDPAPTPPCQTVIVTTNEVMTQGSSYNLTVGTGNITDENSNSLGSSGATGSFVGDGAPSLAAATFVNPDTDGTGGNCGGGGDCAIIEATFSEAMKVTTALTTASNYTLASCDSGVTAESPATTITVVAASKVRIEFDVTGAGPSSTCQLTVANVVDLNENTIAGTTSRTFTYSGTDNIKPTVSGITPLSNNQVKITFSEPVTQSLATQASNYGISPSLNVNNVVCKWPPVTECTLTTDPQSVQTYTITVSNVTDTAGNVIDPSGASGGFTGQPPADTSGPTIASINVINEYLIEVVYSEDVDFVTGQSLGNYGISPSLNITSAAQQADKSKIQLTLGTPTTNGSSYTLTVSNVEDTLGNAITASSTSDFTGVDTVGPFITSVVQTTDQDNQLTVTFSETMNATDIANLANYSLSPAPSIQSIDCSANPVCVITTSSNLTNSSTYNLSITNVRDSAGNTIVGPNSGSFTAIVPFNSVAPKVLTVSSTLSDGTYVQGSLITVTVLFDQIVIVNTTGGTPDITLETGTTDRKATYASGSNSDTLTFHYTIQTGDTTTGDATTGLDYTATSALALNSGTIKNSVGTDATLTLPTVGAANSLSDSKTIEINGTADITAPQITGVTNQTADPDGAGVRTTDGPFGVGEQITIRLTFDENVIVGGGSAPTLKLETGATDRDATYSTGSGGTTLDFVYTIQAGDNSTDLAYLSTTALSLNTGTIKDAAGNDATLTLPTVGGGTSLSGGADVVVDTTAPSQPGVAPDLAAGSDSGSSNTDNITNVSSADFTGAAGSVEGGATVKIYSGGTLLGTATAAGDGSYTVSANLSLLSDASHDITITQTDVAGNTSVLSSAISITRDSTAPTISSITSDKANATYDTGEVIDIDINFSENVTLTGGGALRAVLILSPANVNVDISTISDTNAVSGNYTVSAGESASDLNVTSPLTKTAGNIQDAAGNELTLNIPGGQNLADNKDIAIAAGVPVVDNVSATNANNTYNAGTELIITVTFNTAVDVTGSPQILLDMAGTDRQATYNGTGSGTTTIQFAYTIVASDNNAGTDLDYVATNSLTLNGGSINKSGSATAANLTLATPGDVTKSLAGTKDIKVDNTNPTAASSVTVPSYSSSTSVTTNSYTIGTDTNFSTHNVKACTDSGCSTSCTTTTQDATAPSTVTGLSNGTAYYVCIQSVDLAGNTAAWVASAGTVTVDTTDPAAPSSVTVPSGATGTMTGVTYTNGTDTNFSTHNVKACTDTGCSAGCVGAATDAASPVDISGMTSGTAYYACIQSVDLAGNTSAWVASGATVTSDQVNPTAPSSITVPTWSSSTAVTTNTFTNGTDAIGFNTHNVKACTNSGCSTGCTSVTQDSSAPTTVTGLSSGTAYYVCVQSVDNAGNTSAYVASAATVTVDTVDPVAPSGVTQPSAAGSSMNVTYTNGSDAISFKTHNVKACTDTGCSAGCVGASTDAATPVTISGLVADTAYYACIQSEDDAGNTSAWVASGGTVTSDQTNPTAPSGITVPAGVNSNSVTTNAFTNGTDANFSTHNIKACTDTGCSTACVGAATDSAAPVTISGLLNATNYYACVQAVDTAGNTSAWVASAGTVAVDTADPTAPSGITVPSYTSTTSVTTNTFTNGTDAISFDTHNIKACTDSGCSTGCVGAATDSASPVTISGLSNGTSYYACVQSVDTATNTSAWVASAGTVTVDTTDPAAPSSVTQPAAAGTSMDITFTNGTDTNFSTHNIKACTDSGCSTGCVGASTDAASPATIGSLVGGTAYYACVQSVDLAGNTSAWVASGGTVTSDQVNPTDPSGVTVPTHVNTTSVTTNSFTNGTDAVSFNTHNIKACTNSGCSTGCVGAATDSSAPVTISGLSAGTTYYACVQSVDSAGNVGNWVASAGTVTVDQTDPTAASGITVPTWSTSTTVSTNTFTNGTDAVSFSTHNVKACTDSGCSTSCTGVTQDAAAPVSVSGLSNGTAYYVCVQSVDTAGNTAAYVASASTVTIDNVNPNAPASVTVPSAANATMTGVTFTNGTDAISFSTHNLKACTDTGCSTSCVGATTDAASPADIGSLVNGTAYYACVQSVDSAGNTSAWVASGSTVTSDQTNPSDPSGITVPTHVNTTSVTTNTFTDGTDAVSFSTHNIKACTDTGCSTSCVGASTDASAPVTISGLSAGTSYYACVQSVDSAGNVGNWVASAGTVTVDQTDPTAASGITVPTWSTSTTVSTNTFTNGTDAVSFSTHNVKACTDSGCSTSCTGVTQDAAAPVSVSGLSNGTAYYVCVQSVDTAGNTSAYVASAATVTIDNVNPNAPSSVTAPSAANATMTGVTFTNGTDAISFSTHNLKACTDTGCSTSCVGATTDAASPADIGSLVGGTAYYACVQSVDSAGNTSTWVASGSTVTSDQVNPTDPSGITVPTYTTTTSVTTNSFTNGTDAVAFSTHNIKACTDSGCSTGCVGASTDNAAPVTISGLSNGTSYYACVQSVDTAGNTGNWVASAATVTVDATDPVISSVAPATSATVSDKKHSFTFSEACASATIKWTRTGGTADGGSPHTANLTGSELNSGAHTDITLTNEASLSLVNGSIYTVDWDCTDAAGNTATTVSSTNVTYNSGGSDFTITAAETLDCDPVNGLVDHYKVTFGRAADDSTFDGYALNAEGAATTKWTVAGRTNPRLDHGTAVNSLCGTDTNDDATIYIKFDEGATVDTGETPDLTGSTTTLVSVTGPQSIFPSSGTPGTWDAAAVTESDKAGPYAYFARAIDVAGGAGIENTDKLEIRFSETTNAPNFKGDSTDLDTIFAIQGGSNNLGDIATNITSTAWSMTTYSNDTLTITFAGAFTNDPNDGDTVETKGAAGLTDGSSNLTPNEAAILSPPTITGSFTAGNDGPIITAAVYEDHDGNGKIDHLKITFDENVDDSTFPGYVSTSAEGSTTSAWSVSGYLNVRIDPTVVADTDDDTTIYIKFDEGPNHDTGAKPDMTVTDGGLRNFDSGPGPCYINTSATQCVTPNAADADVGTTDVIEGDNAKPIITFAAGKKGTTDLFVSFSENVWGATGTPACGSGGQLIAADFDYPTTGTGSVTSITGMGSDACAATDGYVRTTVNAAFVTADYDSDEMGAAANTIYDAADNAMADSEKQAIVETVAPYLLALSSYVSGGNYYIRVFFSEPVSTAPAADANSAFNTSNYNIVENTSTSCTDIAATPTAVTAVGGTARVFDLQTGTQCGDSTTPDTLYKVTVSNVKDQNELETIAAPTFGTVLGTENPDDQPPRLLLARSLSLNQVELTFSEPMRQGDVAGSAECDTTYSTGVTCSGDVDSVTAGTQTKYTLTPSLGTITSVLKTADASVYIMTHSSNQTGSFYALTVYSGFTGTTSGTKTTIPADANSQQYDAQTPSNQATFQGSGSSVDSFDDGPIFTDPFGDGSSFSFAFVYANRVYLGPNDNNNGAYRFEPDGTNPVSIGFLTGGSYPGFTQFGTEGSATGPNSEEGISFFQNVTFADAGTSADANFLILTGTASPKLNEIWWTTDLDTTLDWQDCNLNTSSGMNGVLTVYGMGQHLWAGVAGDGSKRPVIRKYSVNTSTGTCAVEDVTNWNNGTQDIIAIGDADIAPAGDGILGIDIITELEGNLALANNGGVAYAAVSDTGDDNGGTHEHDQAPSVEKPNLSSDFSAVIDESNGPCTTVPTNWCQSTNRTLRVNNWQKVPPGRKGIPFLMKWNNVYYLARNVTNAGNGQTRVGGELWKCSTTCTTASNWSRVLTTTSSGSGSGIESTNNIAVSTLVDSGTYLYIGFDNMADGARIYRASGEPTGPGSFSEVGRVSASCTNHSGDQNALGGVCYAYQFLSNAQTIKSGGNFLYMTTGCKETTTDGTTCDTDASAAFVAPSIRVLMQKD